MNQTLFLMRHELRLMWKEFKFSLKRSLTVVLIIQVVVMVAISNLVLELILSALFNTYPDVLSSIVDTLAKAGLTGSRISDILYLVFLLFLLPSITRGVLSSSFGLLFTRVDENLISASPMAPHALFVAKKTKGFVIHNMEVAILLIAAFPFVSRIGFDGIQFGLLFISLVALIEFYGLTENAFHCLSKALAMRQWHLKILGLVVLVALIFYSVLVPLLIIVGANLGSINTLLYFYPPYSLSKILTLNMSINIETGVISVVSATIVLFIIAAGSAKFGLKRWSSSPRLAQSRGRFLSLRRNKLTWKPGSKNDVNLILRKEFWVTVRNPSRFIIPLAIALALMILTMNLELLNAFPPLQLSKARYTEPIFLLSTYFVAVFLLSPAWDSFAGERRTVHLLKTAPIDPGDIVKGKYLFALMKSLMYVVPIVIALSLIIPHTLSISFALLEVFLILLVSNAIGILASVSYPPAYRGVGPPPFLIVIGLPLVSALLTAVIPLSLLTYYTSFPLFALMSWGMILYSLVVLMLCIRRATRSFASFLET